jgi:hypothetical protein
MNDIATSQHRLTVAKVAVGMFIYVRTEWVRVVDVHTAAGITEIYLVGQADPIEYPAGDDIDVCLPIRPS